MCRYIVSSFSTLSQVFEEAHSSFSTKCEFSGRTALIALCDKDTKLTPEKLRLFDRQRADFNTKVQDGNTALLLCCSRKENMRAELMAVFKEAGCILPRAMDVKQDHDFNSSSHEFLEGKRRYWGDEFRPDTPPPGCEHLFD